MSESSWLEHELATHLGQTSAPAGLWVKIQRPQRVNNGVQRLVLPAFALLILLASADLLWEVGKSRGAFGHSARPTATELAAISAGQCDLWSSDPAHIRQWIKSRSGMEIELPSHSPSVRMVGARLVNLRGTLVASISYESQAPGQAPGEAPRQGNMLVWKDGHEHRKHAAPLRTAELVSWTQGDNVFAVNAADESAARGACMLCHPEGTHGI
jgi:hypothetical protein